MVNSNYIIEYYKEFGYAPKLGKFQFEDTLKTALNMPPEKALEWLKKRGQNLKISESWDSLNSEAHNKAFTVAKVMSAEILQLIYDNVEQARTQGWSLKQFKENLMPALQNAGWSGLAPSRLKVIYDTNIQMAYAKGQYKQLKLLAEMKPYWEYHQIERNTKRHNHSLFHGKKFKHDDPIWNFIFPPSGFGCKCSIIATNNKDGLDDGSKYTDDITKNQKDFEISPLKAWKPDTTKFVDKIQEQLDKLLSPKPETEIKSKKEELPTCTEQEFFNSWGFFLDRDAMKEFLKYFNGKPMTFKQFASCFAVNTSMGRCVYDRRSENLNVYIKNNDVAIQRGIDFETKTAYHEFYKILSGNQGKNEYKKLFLKQLALYHLLGLEKIELHADIDIGCWAWARYGFRLQYISKYHIEAFGLEYNLPIDVVADCFVIKDFMINNFERLSQKANVPLEKIKDFVIANRLEWHGYFNLSNKEQLEMAEKYCNKE